MIALSIFQIFLTLLVIAIVTGICSKFLEKNTELIFPAIMILVTYMVFGDK